MTQKDLPQSQIHNVFLWLMFKQGILYFHSFYTHTYHHPFEANKLNVIYIYNTKLNMRLSETLHAGPLSVNASI